MDRDQVNGFMSENILRFKKCSENRGAGERVAGQGAAMEPVPQKSQRRASQAEGTIATEGPAHLACRAPAARAEKARDGSKSQQAREGQETAHRRLIFHKF